jgi:hypothetical protein
MVVDACSVITDMQPQSVLAWRRITFAKFSASLYVSIISLTPVTKNSRARSINPTYQKQDFMNAVERARLKSP